MQCKTFAELKSTFETNLNTVGTLLELRDYAEDDTCTENMQLVMDDVREVVSTIAKLKTEIKKETDKLKQLQELQRSFKQLKSRLTYSLANIPERMPKHNPVRKEETSERENTNNNNSRDTASDLSNNNAASTEKNHPQTGKETTIPTTASSEAAATQKAGSKGQPNTYIPEIDYLTVDEFDSVPKYMKGRLNYNHVNKFIDGMNAAYKAKYRLIKQRPSTLNISNKRKLDAYKLQGNKDTKGCYFIVDDDIKEYSGTKIEKTGRSILTIIRHCGRMKEVRGGRLTRYVYLASY